MNTMKNSTIVSTTRETGREYPLTRTRNLGIAAHIDAGKTTLTERILLYTGAIHRAGEVHTGNTTTDSNPIEQEKGITIFAAAVSSVWTQTRADDVFKLFANEPHRLNIIDTPGHVDFTVEVERSLRVLDGMVAVFSGVDGVQSQSETVWRQADKYRVPRVVFVNKMDRTGANFARVVDDIRHKLGANAAPVLIPLGAEDALRGQLDIVNRKAFVFGDGALGGFSVENVPPDQEALVTRARSELIERVAEVDEEIAALWLDNQPVSADVLKRAIRRATIANRLVPVIGGSAYKFVGVQPLLDAIVDYLPSPADMPAVEAHSADTGESVRLTADDDAPVAALAFKLVSDPQAGRIVWLRLYTGTLRKGDTVMNSRTGKTERVGRLVRIFADRRIELVEAHAGEICGVIGLRSFTTGDTLCAPAQPVLLEPPVFPEPVVTVAIEPRTNEDREKLGAALARLSEEDPTLRLSTHPETGQCLLSGMGELHLDITRTRLADEHHVATIAGAPEIAHRETITRATEADHLLKKQNGGVGMFARVILSVAPAMAGSGLSIENRITGGSIPVQFHGAVKKGILEAAREGVLGHPLVDVQVAILDGAFHAKDSNDLAFQLAAADALRTALRDAGPVLLEPVMHVEVNVPTEHQGDILGDLTRRRGQVLAVETSGSNAVVQADVPLAELFGYANAIRSLSKGRAAYSMKPNRFQPVPDALVKKQQR